MLKSYEKKVLRLFILILILISSILFIYFRPFFIVRIVGNSMYPNYKDGQLVLTNKLDKNYSIGDVVLADQDSEYIVKRIAYVGGQKIPIANLGMRRYQPLPYLKDMEEHMAHLNKRGIRSEYYTIPNGYYFLIGDNTAESEDSRIFGAIPKDSIKAKIVEL